MRSDGFAEGAPGGVRAGAEGVRRDADPHGRDARHVEQHEVLGAEPDDAAVLDFGSVDPARNGASPLRPARQVAEAP